MSICYGANANSGLIEMEPIAGDTRFVNIRATEMAQQFVNELNGRYEGTMILQVPPFNKYFTETNVEYICYQIARVLENLFPGEKFVVPVNAELADTIISTALSNIGLAGGGDAELAFMNREVIEYESTVQYSSMRNTLRYFKYILENDRMKTMPYGEYTKATKGEVTVSTSQYALSHPWAKERDSYMLTAEGMTMCPTTNQYMRIPNYLMPTVPRQGQTVSFKQRPYNQPSPGVTHQTK